MQKRKKKNEDPKSDEPTFTEIFTGSGLTIRFGGSRAARRYGLKRRQVPN